MADDERPETPDPRSECQTGEIGEGGCGAPGANCNVSRLTPEAFAQRFQAAWHPLWLIAAAVLNDRAGADDVLQESAMIALGKLAQFDPATNFTAWMGRIVRFVALNHARRRFKMTASSDQAALESIETSPRHGDDPILTGHGQLMSEAVAESNFDDRVMSALRGLDGTARACLLLRIILEMPYREISLALDIAEGTAMSHVHRARAALRERLGGGSEIRPGSNANTNTSHESGRRATSDRDGGGSSPGGVNGRKRGEMGGRTSHG